MKATIIYVRQYRTFATATAYAGGKAYVGYVGSPSTVADALNDLHAILRAKGIDWSEAEIVQADYSGLFSDSPIPCR